MADDTSGEPLSARLRRVEQERDQLAGHLEGSRRVAADLMRERDMIRAELASAQQELQRLRDHDGCAWQGLARTAIKERRDAIEQADRQRSWQVARDDYGLTCVQCGRPIVRGQAVEPQPGTTKGSWQHVCCPDPTTTKES